MTRLTPTGLALLLLVLTACQAPRPPFDATLVFSNGIMGGLEPCECPSSPMGGVARQATVLRGIRQTSQRVVLLDGGDTLLGTEQSDADGGRSMIEAMNRLGYQAMVLGEQDQLPPGELAQRASAARFPVLGRVAGMSLPERAIVEQGGKRFGLVAITRGKDEELKEALARARSEAKRLRGKVDLLVGINHLVGLEDSEVAKEIPQLHVLLGGHPRLTGATSWVGKTLVMNGFPMGGKALSTLKLTFDPRQGKVSQSELERISLGPRVPDDPEMRAWLTSRFPRTVAAKPWPNLPITTMDGQPVFPSTWRGSPGLVMVACWCPSCQTVIQDLEALHQTHPEWSMRVMSLVSSKATAYHAKRLKVTLPLVVDEGGKGFELLGKPECPHLYMMDAKGMVRGELSREEISPKRLEELLKGLAST